MRRLFLILMAVSPLLSQSTGKTEPGKYDPANINYGFGGILPKDVPYKPMTGEQRWRMFINDEFKNLGSYMRAFGTAAVDQRRETPAGWDQDAGGYAQRWASRFGKFAISSGIEHSTAAALGHDPRYIRCRCEGFFARTGHAIGYNFVSYNRRGERVFYVSRIAGAFGGEALSTVWLPGQKWYVEGYQGAIQQITIGSLVNVMREFGPEIKRKFRRKR